MSGYTPLFSTLATGTLYGRWPDIGLWPIVLSLSDRHGVVDVTPHYLAGVTGLPVEDVIACMARFCQPDPYSRSKSESGSRLVLVDEHRDWGWKIVNHGKYREKARKAAYDADRTESGQDAERKRQERKTDRPDTSRDVPTPDVRPGVSRALPLSDSDSDSDSDSEKILESRRDTPRAPRSVATRLPPDFELTPELEKIASTEGLAPQRTFEKFCDYWHSASGANARKHDWKATWRNWCRTEADRLRSYGGGRVTGLTRAAKSADEIEREASRAAS